MFESIKNKVKNTVATVNKLKDDAIKIKDNVSNFVQEEDKVGFLKDKAKEAIIEKKNEIQEQHYYETHKYELAASGENLPDIDPIGVILKKGESCHYASSATRVIISTKTSYKTASAGISFRVAKGVYVNTRQGAAEPVKTQKSEEFPGNIYITNKRILFLSMDKSADIPLDKINGYKLYQDGIGLYKGETFYLFKVNDPKMALATLSGIANKYELE